MRQAGFFSLVAVILILVVGFMGVGAISAFNAELIAVTTQTAAQQALLAAHAGMERTGNRLLTTNASLQLSCNNTASNALIGNSVVTNATLGSNVAQFTVTNRHATGGMYSSSTATLTAAVTATTTTFSVSTTSSYAPSGWLVAGSEIISYSGKTANSFTGLVRGVKGTQAQAYAAGTALNQSQCDLASTGAVKTFISPFAQRQINFSVLYNMPQPDGWVVGFKGTGNARVARWNTPTVNAWNYQLTSATSADLHGVSLLNSNYGFAVGNPNSGSSPFNIIFWNGSAWVVSPKLPPIKRKIV